MYMYIYLSVLFSEKSLSCSFEEPYLCGYSFVKGQGVQEWLPLSASTETNVGPMTDHTFGNSKGKERAAKQAWQFCHTLLQIFCEF